MVQTDVQFAHHTGETVVMWDPRQNLIYTVTAGGFTLLWLFVIGVVLLVGGQPPDPLLVLAAVSCGTTWLGVIRYDRHQSRVVDEPDLERLR